MFILTAKPIGASSGESLVTDTVKTSPEEQARLDKEKEALKQELSQMAQERGSISTKPKVQGIATSEEKRVADAKAQAKAQAEEADAKAKAEEAKEAEKEAEIEKAEKAEEKAEAETKTKAEAEAKAEEAKKVKEKEEELRELKAKLDKKAMEEALVKKMGEFKKALTNNPATLAAKNLGNQSQALSKQVFIGFKEALMPKDNTVASYKPENRLEVDDKNDSKKDPLSTSIDAEV